MIVITGGSGFIGSNLVKHFNEQGRTDILLVDDFSDGKKMFNLADCDIADYCDKDDFLLELERQTWSNISVIFHQGACSTTTEWNGRYMMDINYQYSKRLLHHCIAHNIPLIYASSASVYGSGEHFIEERQYEQPINMYAYSKFLFDQYVRRLIGDGKITSQVVGLRYFNVYGPREQHKGTMSSVAFHFNQQIRENGKLKLFDAYATYDAGEQRRDFIYVADVVKVNQWFFDNPQASGIFNCGTGRSQTFNDIAQAVIDYHQQGEIHYIPFPEHLKGAYQSFTEADLTRLRQVGCDVQFLSVQEGVWRYLSEIN